jgi:type I restriction enzyme S subunit
MELGAGLSVKHGFAFRGEFFRDSGDLIVLTPGNFLEGGGFKLKSKEKFYDGPIPDGYLLRRGDVVVAMTEQSKGLLGSTATVPADATFLHNQRLGLLQVTDPGVLSLRYCYHLLNSPDARNQIQATATGSKVRHTAPERIESIRVALPDLAYQRKVASALDSVEVLIENNRRRIEILEEMARLIYREWFVHFRFPGHKDVELVDSNLGPIPDGWEAVPLSELVTTEYGYTESAQEEPVGPRYLRGMDMNKSSFIDWSAVPYCPISDRDREKFKVDVGDVFVIRMADPGKVGICEREVDAVFASYLVRLKPVDARLLPYYLFFTSSDDRYQGWVTGASTGATRKSVSAKVMTEPPVVLPPQDVQAQFVETVAPIRGLLTNLLEQNGVLTAARDLLLPRLISGELDVSDLDLDLEPVA